MGVREMLDLGGRVAVVTGGSRGLGLQIAEGLGEMGAKIAITARKPEELDKAKAHLEGQGIEVVAVPSDIARPEAPKGLVDVVLERFGRIDILVNNAGATWGARAEEHPLEAWAKVIDLNLNGLFALTQEVARRCLLPQGRGRIINVSSVAGLGASPPEVLCAAAYHASKGAVVNLTRALAAEWGGRGITVNGICPGFFHSKMADRIIERSEELLLRLTPRGQLGGEEDLKGLAVLLASDASAHINGQNIAVDGGMSVL
jgi:NAD(P)-dependent dehydrogenase (short-subunit alcohol dehydrogenase family)